MSNSSEKKVSKPKENLSYGMSRDMEFLRKMDSFSMSEFRLPTEVR